MARTPSYDRYGRRKGKWTPEEDRRLCDFVNKYGVTNWRLLPILAGLSRCGKSCRLRWMNYLRPNVKHGNYSKQEEEIIIRLHQLLGNKWSAIAAQLPGRTDNEVKNHWHTYLKKRLLQEQSSPSVSITSHTAADSDLSPEQATREPSGELEIHCDNIPSDSSAVAISATGLKSDVIPLLSSPVASSSSEPISLSTIETGSARVPISSWELDISSAEMCAVSPGRFWTEPFIPDTSFDMMIPGCYSELYSCQEHFSFMFESHVLYSLW